MGAAIKGDFNLESRRWDEAINDYTEAIQLEPEVPHAFCGRGFAHESKGDLRKALADYREAIRLDPHSTIANAGWDRVAQRMGSLDLAIVVFAEGTKFGNELGTEENPTAKKSRSELLARHWDEAIAGYTQGIQAHPESSRLVCGRALAYEGKGALQKAHSDYFETIQLDPKCQIALAGWTRVESHHAT